MTSKHLLDWLDDRIGVLATLAGKAESEQSKEYFETKLREAKVCRKFVARALPEIQRECQRDCARLLEAVREETEDLRRQVALAAREVEECRRML